MIRTTISSPKAPIVATLKERDVLRVEKLAATGPVVLKTDDGKEVGSITSGQLLRLMQCIDEGYRYVAIVKSIDKGKVEVEVRPEPAK